MKSITNAAYQELMEEADVIARDAHGIKVARLSGGDMVKLFRLKRLVSSALFYPYAKRFERASRELARRSIPTVTVRDVFRIKGTRRDGVVYEALPGMTCRAALERPGASETLFPLLATFWAELHAKGVYFRAAHLANVLITPDERLGLIDISEVRTRRRRLSVYERARNFKCLTRYPEDRAALAAFGVRRFVEAYLAAAKLDRAQEMRLDRLLRGMTFFRRQLDETEGGT